MQYVSKSTVIIPEPRTTPIHYVLMDAADHNIILVLSFLTAYISFHYSSHLLHKRRRRNMQIENTSINCFPEQHTHVSQAIRLNDMGVLMLHRHCFHEAILTFKDAVRAVQIEFEMCSSREEKLSQLLDLKLMHINAQTRLRMAQPLPFTRCHTGSNKKSAVRLSTVLLLQESDTQANDDVVGTLQALIGSPLSPVAIFIESAEGFQDLKKQSRLDLLASVIMYNLGIAHYMYAITLLRQQKLPLESYANDTILSRSLMIMDMSDSVLCASRWEDSFAQSRKLLLVRMFLMLSLHREERQIKGRAEKTREKLSQIHTMLSLKGKNNYRDLSSTVCNPAA